MRKLSPNACEHKCSLRPTRKPSFALFLRFPPAGFLFLVEKVGFLVVRPPQAVEALGLR
jgi:hypothetical protein